MSQEPVKRVFVPFESIVLIVLLYSVSNSRSGLGISGLAMNERKGRIDVSINRCYRNSITEALQDRYGEIYESATLSQSLNLSSSPSFCHSERALRMTKATHEITYTGKPGEANLLSASLTQ